MEIHVNSQSLTLPAHAGADIARRVRFIFDRLAPSVARLHITLKDVNGPRGGRDKVCVVRAELAGGGQVVVQDRSVRMRRALGRGLRRAKSIVTDQIRRRRDIARQPKLRPRLSLAEPEAATGLA
jgi:hypothetical protein